MIGYAVLGGFVLDAIFGDPAWLPHPVVYMGKAISALEKGLRARLPKTPEGELWGGRILAFCLPVGTFAITSLVCMGAAALHPLLGLAVQMFWCGQALAAKGLVQESTNVYRELTKPDLPAARIAVSRIVGRDTQALTAEGVTKAAVETVAENASDGVIAPLLYMLLGGAPLALTYKAINTMDSMVGYKNTQYLYFGRAAAKLDDIANFLPSRIAALLWVAAAALTGNDARSAWRIWRRDRRNHASPNSAQTESACAGALNVQLAGPAYYFGEYYKKPTIGDAVRPIEPEDIRRADRMMYAESLLATGPVTGRSTDRTRWTFRPMSARWGCRRGWQKPSPPRLSLLTATPTPSAALCGQSWRCTRRCPQSISSAETARQTLSSDWCGRQSPAPPCCPPLPLRSMPPRWKPQAAPSGGISCARTKTLQ